MNYAKGLTYEQVKANINWMLAYYDRDILADPRTEAMPLDDIEILYQLDQEMIAYYKGCLLLLEAQKLLGLI